MGGIRTNEKVCLGDPAQAVSHGDYMSYNFILPKYVYGQINLSLTQDRECTL